MKIKITLIAFIASALMFTSCMKNESSSGIESVREAYASLLLAKAQAEVILANAEASYMAAEAAVQLSIAAMNDAIAANDMQEVARLQAVLAQQLIQWGFDNEASQLAADSAMAAYEAAILEAKNDLVVTYYLNYVNALGKMRDVQGKIYDANLYIYNLGLDLENNTSFTLAGLVADLAAANTYLAMLQAEYDNMNAIVGDAAAVNARIDELNAEIKAQKAAILLLKVDEFECNEELPTEPTLDSQFLTDLNTANTAVDSAEAWYLEGYDYIPAWWTQLQTTIDSLLAVQSGIYGDTVTSYDAWKPIRDSIDNGTDAIDLLITEQEGIITDGIADSTQAVADSLAALVVIGTQEGIIAGLIADTVLAHDNDSIAQDNIDAIAADSTIMADESDSLTQVNIDLAAQNVLLVADTATLVTGYVALRDAHSPGDALYIFYQDKIDAAHAQIIANEMTISDNNDIISYNTYTIGLLTLTRPDRNAEKLVTEQALADAISDYNTGKVDPLAEIEDQEVILHEVDSTIAALIIEMGTANDYINDDPGGLEAQKVLLLARIEVLKVMVVDLYSNYLHTLTFIDEMDDEIAAAIQAKADRRTEYETFMDEAFDSHLLGLQNTAATALEDYNEAYGEWETDHAEWAELAAPCLELKAEKDALQAAQDANKDLVDLWKDIRDFQKPELEAFEDAIADQDSVIAEIEGWIVTAEDTYAKGMLEYTEYAALVASLEAELAVAQELVAKAKAKLEEALANL